MKTKTDKHHSRRQASRQPVRLAQSAIAAVDVCDCGVMQVHIGALTLRMAPEAVSELLATLGRAVAANAATRLTMSSGGLATDKRGQA